VTGRPTDDSFGQIGFVRRGPHQWLAPLAVLRQGRREAYAEQVTGYTDRREVLAALDPEPPCETFDLSDADDVWVDYLSDTGDGFDAVYTLAWLLSHEELAVGDADTRAGRLLVLGGDETYPTASDDQYRDRLAGPLRAAVPERPEPARQLLAIPGNHDWYDGLGAFTRRFVHSGWIGAWRTAQRRSYWAVRLPHGWWLWGVDIALEERVDHPQIEYFEAMARRAVELGDGQESRLVICTAKPSWQRSAVGADPAQAYDAGLDYLESRVARANGLRVVATISGDEHHYARYEPSGDGPVRLTWGGGGAFLHPTDHLPEQLAVDRRAWTGHERVEALDLAARYPSTETCRRLRWRALWFGWHNRGFLALTAIAYLSWMLPVSVRIAALGALTYMLVQLARRPRVWEGLLWGVPHAAVHIAVMAAVATAADAADLDSSTAQAWLRAGVLAVVGAVVGPIIVGLYFVIAGRLRGVNDNEAFSAIRVQDHKGILRLHVRTDGALDVYPVGVDRINRSWRFSAGGALEDPWFVPSGEAPEPRLVDEVRRLV
jgi:hypothetical protein